MPDNPGSDQERTPRIAEEIAGAALDPDIYLRPGEDVTLELDADVITWFKEREEGLETAINAALRDYIGHRCNAP